ncbi:hypothetical protein PNA2_1399 [Pyrococcus sp. NA2]|uniref:hypothetical protein n=1 Tax=Pyrococcus sp. (strain NA2) TaxID=342949 RepID=UPI000209AEAC|nr:hypothetical protein [Pyrococcus sp. NA2]AEC52314.1 hypothetical protein PNA2_1399 [Pyrococcus sp. NA2]
MEDTKNNEHEIKKKEVVEVLRFYGFSARAEVYGIKPEGGVGRADVVGKKGSITIGVEIVDSGDVARDAKKLTMNNYDYRYIIVLNPSKKVDEIIVDGKRVKVLDSVRAFEHELRKDLGIPPDYPYFFQSRVEKPPEVFLESSEKELNKVIEELEEYGLENFTEEVLDALGMVYISRALAVELRVHYNPFGPPTRYEYESVNIKPQILSILQRLNLVNTERIGSGEWRKTIAYPTQRGLKVGHELILKRIREHKSKLEEIAREYGDKLWIILHGSLWYTPDYYSLEIITRDYSSAFEKEKEDPILKTARYIRILGRYSHFDLDYMSLPEHPLFLMFSNFLTNTVLKEDAIRFFKRLETYGLAISDVERDSRARPIWDVIKAPIEVFKFFLYKTKRPGNFAYYAQKFGVYYTLLHVGDIYHPPTAREEYEKLVRTLELDENLIAEVLAEMNKRGITSRLVKDPEKAPFIILDKKGFEEYIKFSLTAIAEKFQEG